MIVSHGPGCRHIEERVGEQILSDFPTIPMSALGLPGLSELGGVWCRKTPAGWARLTPPWWGADPRRRNKEPQKSTRHWKGAMAGTSLGARFYRQIKRHPGLIPMIGFIGLGMGSAALYLLRLALRSPDVCWDRKNNPEPWNRLSPNDQYKVLPVPCGFH
ncbi:NADH dehydrogenase [ubiquinone] 1 alpha subcomplex subunit 4-like 2 isoform X2 [Ictidomys tridecemlineatus]|uniref:NADH dehydrogenase [ubiquinone] 1 alpha subcomplex subunit 4-like 2 isoform X2 n=1 Tax=Ictidomys tridecemlineatus TaxID=43179 RepID=UPI001A9E6567|nr:NADH dehydrogenase [ubiquinone] 1 alpha subcomplex subunit 4-like 2 isoform X2 [Ictidomys tridecemlineatus]